MTIAQTNELKKKIAQTLDHFTGATKPWTYEEIADYAEERFGDPVK